MTGSGASPEFITPAVDDRTFRGYGFRIRSEEHTSELQSRSDLVCRLLLEKKKKTAELQSRSDVVCCLLVEKNTSDKIREKVRLRGMIALYLTQKGCYQLRRATVVEPVLL